MTRNTSSLRSSSVMPSPSLHLLPEDPGTRARRVPVYVEEPAEGDGRAPITHRPDITWSMTVLRLLTDFAGQISDNLGRDGSGNTRSAALPCAHGRTTRVTTRPVRGRAGEFGPAAATAAAARATAAAAAVRGGGTATLTQPRRCAHGRSNARRPRAWLREQRREDLGSHQPLRRNRRRLHRTAGGVAGQRQRVADGPGARGRGAQLP